MTLREQVEALRPKDGEPGRHVTREMLIALCDAALKVGEVEDRLAGANALGMVRIKELQQELATAARSLAEAERERDEARASEAAIRELMNCYNVGGWTDAESAMKRALEAERSLAGMREACAKVADELAARWRDKRMSLKDRHGSEAAHYLTNAFAAEDVGKHIRALPAAAGGGDVDKALQTVREHGYEEPLCRPLLVPPAPIRARTETEWIPVSERLPDDDKDGAQVIGCFTYEGGSQMVGAISVTKLLAGKLDRVTSWQPLPAPPAAPRAAPEETARARCASRDGKGMRSFDSGQGAAGQGVILIECIFCNGTGLAAAPKETKE